MSKLFQFTPSERGEAFLAAEEVHPLGLPAYIIEKDFWVTQTLKVLYKDIAPRLASSQPFIFKGGTSLSKCFNAINRMSEDIDLSFSLELLGHTPVTRDVAAGRGKRLELAIEIDLSAADFIEKMLLPQLVSGLKDLDGRVDIVVENDTPLDIAIYYPKDLNDDYYGNSVRPRVLLETGGRSDNSPVESVSVNHMLSQCLEHFFDEADFQVLALSPQRTMLEKMFGVHTNITQCKPQPKYARHLYDIIQLHRTNPEWYLNRELFFSHVEFSDIHYKTHLESCNSARLGPLRLVPDNDDMLAHYLQDWETMTDMFPHGVLPHTFNELIEQVSQLQRLVNFAWYSERSS